MTTPNDNNPSIPDLHFGNAPQFLAKRLAVPGVLILVLNDDGTVGLNGHGVNHAKANEMLSLGIHMNLTQHDDFVRKGHAGKEAAEHIRELDNHHREEVTQ